MVYSRPFQNLRPRLRACARDFTSKNSKPETLSAENFEVMVLIKLKKMTQNAEMEVSTVKAYHEYTAFSCFTAF